MLHVSEHSWLTRMRIVSKMPSRTREILQSIDRMSQVMSITPAFLCTCQPNEQQKTIFDLIQSFDFDVTSHLNYTKEGCADRVAARAMSTSINRIFKRNRHSFVCKFVLHQNNGDYWAINQHTKNDTFHCSDSYLIKSSSHTNESVHDEWAEEKMCQLPTPLCTRKSICRQQRAHCIQFEMQKNSVLSFDSEARALLQVHLQQQSFFRSIYSKICNRVVGIFAELISSIKQIYDIFRNEIDMFMCDGCEAIS